MSDQQSVLTKTAPEQTPQIKEKLHVKNAMSVVLNRIREVEIKSQKLLDEASFLRQQLEEFFNEN